MLNTERRQKRKKREDSTTISPRKTAAAVRITKHSVKLKSNMCVCVPVCGTNIVMLKCKHRQIILHTILLKLMPVLSSN